MTGRCLCGCVRFEITEPLTAWGEAAVPVRAYRPPDGFEKLFCAECGSALFSRDPHDPATMSVRLGVLDGDPGVPASWRQHLASAASWEPVPDDGVPRFEGHRSAARA